MRTIHKYPIYPGYVKDDQTVRLEIDGYGEVISCGFDSKIGQPVVWVAVDTDDATCYEVSIYVGTTGNEIKTSGDFIGTVQISNGIVLHLFNEGIM